MLHYVYKVTFPGLKWFYFGVHTENGKPYLGSPVTNRWIWEMYEAELQVIMRFETRLEAEKAEDAIIKATFNDPWSLNANYGGYFPEEARLRGVETQRKNKIGFFGTKWEFEHLSRAGKKGCRKCHEVCSQEGLGFYSFDTQSNGGKIGGKVTSSQKWMDPDHPELGVQNAGNLVRMQKRRGYPHTTSNRVKVNN